MNAGLAAGLCLIMLCTTVVHAEGESPRKVVLECDTGPRPTAVAVPADSPLILTAQVLPLGHRGEIVGAGDAAAQMEYLYEKLGMMLERAGSSLGNVVKLNVYARSLDAAEAVRPVVASAFDIIPAAVSLVVTDLPHEGVLIAADAVAIPALHDAHRPTRDIARLAGGGATFISGQAAKGDMATATRETMAGLGKTLEYLKLTRDDVVHVKAFLQPMSEAATARREIEAFFGPGAGAAPPISFVEWTMNAPIEIEIVAKEAPQQDPNSGAIEFITPPWFKPSPVYCKVTVVHGGSMIFTSGLVSARPMPDAPAEEVRDIFTALGELITKAGGDMTHLAKATYYPATDETSKALNEIRPEFYDPQRPPAASKAPVRGTGIEGRNITLDIIGVTPR